MNRSQMTSSRVLSIPERVDKWSSNIHPNRLEESLQATVTLLKNITNPILAISLIIDKIAELQSSAFTQILKEIIKEVQVLCSNAIIQNLKRASEGKSIIASTANLAHSIEENNLYKGTLVLLNLMQHRAQKKQKIQAFSKMKICPPIIQKSDPDVESNQEIMKFFEGVRRYQDHQDRLGIQALQKLRDHKDMILRNKAMVKGFQMTRFQKVLQSAVNKAEKPFFMYYKRFKNMDNFINVFKSQRSRTLKNSFVHLVQVMKRKTINQLFSSYQDLVMRKELIHISKRLKLQMSRKMNKRSALRKLVALFIHKQISYQHHLMDHLKSKPKLKHERLGRAFIKISDSFLLQQKRKSFRKWANKMASHKTSLIVNRLKSIFWRRIDYSLFKMQSYVLQNKRPILSDNIKGKIVASVMKVKHQDVNLRKAFLKWWLKAKPQAVQKNFMHLFLYAPTRQFTFFFRLKNMIKQSLKPRVNVRSLLFVLLLKEKNQKFMRYKMRESVQKWHQWNKLVNVFVKMNKNLNKLQEYQNNEIVKFGFRTIQQQFDQYNSRKRIMMKFFNAITGSGIGKVFKSIDIWKKLPDNKQIKKRHLMLAAINKALTRIRNQVKNSFIQFKECYLMGEQKKRAAALVMIKATGGSVQQSFKKWEDSMRIHKTITRCKSVGLFLQSLAGVLTSNYIPIFENPRQAYLREKYILKLIAAQTGNIKRCFNILTSALNAARTSEAINQQQKKLLVSRISNMIGNQSATGVKAAIQKLHINMRVKQKQINFINRLMQTKGGKIISAIKTWKDLPEKNKFSKIRNGHKFFSILKKLADKVMIATFKPFVEEFQQGEVKKRGAMGILLNMTSSDVRKYYIKWHSDTKKKHIFDQCNRAISFMQSLTYVIRGNMTIVVESQRAVNLKIKALNQIFENVGGGLQFFFNKWGQTAKFLTMQKNFNVVQRKQYISVLTNGITNKKQDLTKRAILSLHKNLRMKQIAKAFFNKLMDTQAGMVIKSIHQWKSLPSKDANMKKQRAIKFQKKLQDLAERGFRFIYTVLKNQHLYGESKQKFILNKLVKRCMSYQQKKYIHWKSVTKQLMLLQKARLLAKSFENIHSAIVLPLKEGIIQKTKSQLHFKEGLISKLVKNNMAAMDSAFSIWKLWHHNIKTNNRYQLISRLIQISSGKRCKQEAFTNIWQEKELETQRTYINSLWRWKTSQFQAEYYNKFIQMFNESEVLLSFSKILNSRLDLTTSWAFSKLKEVRHSQQIKFNFVKKYFTRKVVSYFDRFRDEVKGRQIKRWKGKFQSSIKGMFMLQSLQKAIKKVQSHELRNWNKRTKKYFRGKSALERLSKLIVVQKDQVLKKLKKNMRMGRIQKASEVLKNYQQNNRRVALTNILQTSALVKMARVICRNWEYKSALFMNKLLSCSQNKALIQQSLKKLSVFILKKNYQRQKQFMYSLKKRARQNQFLWSLSQMLQRKRLDENHYLLQKLVYNLEEQKRVQRNKILQKFYGVYEKICRGCVAKHFGHWKKLRKESIWMKRSVQMMATKPSIRSSLAISLWRMKLYAQKQQQQH